MTYENLLTDVRGDGPRKTGVITLHRPKAMNALNDALMDELGQALLAFDQDTSIAAIVITGSEKAFAAGADIAAMARFTYPQTYAGNFIGRNWDTIRQVRKPVIAAVAGFALGGGCELMMCCDIVVAAENARFGQPEIKLGVIPGAGGTQRLPRAIGKAKAMDLVLTGRLIDAAEAERTGLVSRVVPLERLMTEALEIGEALAALGPDSVMLAKEAVNRAFESPLSEGLRFERFAFQACFGAPEQVEGMAAFLEKRKPTFG